MWKTVLKIGELGFFLALVAALVVVASPILPTRRMFSSYAVVSGSMEPAVPVGALAIVREQPEEKLEQNDIIAFTEPSNPQQIILHRIAEVKTFGAMKQYITKGDNNSVADNWQIGPGQVKGEMVMMVPHLGRALMVARTPIGFALLIGLPAALSMMMYVQTLYEGVTEVFKRRSAYAVATEQKEKYVATNHA